MVSRFLWCLSILCALFGLFTFDPETRRWATVALFLYLLPLFCQFSRNPYLRNYSLWIGLFFVTQTCISAYAVKKYHHLTPNYSEVIDIQGLALPGMVGLQKISTDSLGYRTTQNIDYRKKDGLRIFALGASTTENILLDDQKTWPHLLGKNLELKSGKRIEMINSGASGLRMTQIYENFKKALDYHPDLALFLIGANEWNREIQTHYDPKSIKLSQQYRKLGLEVYDMQKLYLRNTLYGEFFTRLRSPAAVPVPVPPVSNSVRIEKGEYFTKQNNSLEKKDVREYFPSELEPEYLAFLQRTIRLCHKSRVKCVFITQPNAYKLNFDHKLRPYFWMTPPNSDYTLTFDSMLHIAEFYNRKLKEIGEQNHIPVCDLDAVIPPTTESFFDEVHFNINGNKLAAEALTSCLAGML